MTEESKMEIDELIGVLIHQADAGQEMIETLEPGSQERSRQIADVLKIMEHVENVYNKEYDSELKYDEIKRKYRVETAKVAVTGLTAATGLAGIWAYRKSLSEVLHFEQTGSIISSAGKGLMSIMTHLPGIKF